MPRKEHSPGPWRWDGRYLISESGQVVLSTTEEYEPDAADARLLGVAPDLLEALQAFMNHQRFPRITDYDRAAALIRRIEGDDDAP